MHEEETYVEVRETCVRRDRVLVWRAEVEGADELVRPSVPHSSNRRSRRALAGRTSRQDRGCHLGLCLPRYPPSTRPKMPSDPKASNESHSPKASNASSHPNAPNARGAMKCHTCLGHPPTMQGAVCQRGQTRMSPMHSARKSPSQHSCPEWAPHEGFLFAPPTRRRTRYKLRTPTGIARLSAPRGFSIAQSKVRKERRVYTKLHKVSYPVKIK